MATGVFWAQLGTIRLDVEGLLSTAAFGALGLVLVILGFKIFDWLMPKVDVEKELSERNVAVAIVMAAGILGIAAVIVAAIATPSGPTMP